ncbi:hypothetical protein HO931_06810 [Streptococcus suis]|nr:hypothetical protein [Streptococcus suis]NQO21758.1 hypothetical protein [Streptococcus suis]NQP15091.1 hypothetical protein [Streptococcus suis]
MSSIRLKKGGKRAVGFKLSDGLEIPKEFEGKFKFARQRLQTSRRNPWQLLCG